MRLLILSMLIASAASAQTPKVVLADSERQAALNSEIASENFQAKLDVITRSERYPGNDALLLISGKMSFPVRYQLIDIAKKSIIVSTFSLFAGERDGQIEDPSTRLMVEKLIAAKRRGVDVRMIIDGFSSALTGAKSAINVLRDAGIDIVKYNPVVHQNFELNWFTGLPHFLYRFVVLQNPTTNRWHEKTLVVDGQYAVIGGLNWGEHYRDGNNFSSAVNDVTDFYQHPLIRDIRLPPRGQWGASDPDAWRDTDVLVRGPVVAAVVKQLLLDFSILDVLHDKPRSGQYKNASEQDYANAEVLFAIHFEDDPAFFAETTSPALSSGVQARYVSQRPFLERRRSASIAAMRKYAEQNELYVHAENPLLGISNLYVNLINKAEKQILWGSHANRPTPVMMEALVAAAKRGVQIFLIGNSPESAEALPGNGKFLYRKASGLYDELLSRGGGYIRLFEWRRDMNIDGRIVRGGAFHSKVFSVDGLITSVGPYNVSKASFGKHTEGTMVIIDPEFARQTEQMFQHDLEFSREVTRTEITIDQERQQLRAIARPRYRH